jgi:hypothetical protein
MSGKTVTLVLDETVAQLALLALRNAEDRLIGDSFPLDRFIPDLAERQALVKAFHAYNGDPETFEEDMSSPSASQFPYFNPNWSLGMLWDQLRHAMKDAGIEIRADQPDVKDMY